MSTEPPVVFMLPQVKTSLEAEVKRASVSTGLAGGLLFGHPLDEHRRLVVGWVRPRPEVRFGEKGFALDQSRTSEQLVQARKLTPEAHYCGVWYIHRTPDADLTDEEWQQTRSVLEDPDFRFNDLVCLVICAYFGDLTVHASSFNKVHSARGQFPAATHLLLTTDSLPDSTRVGQARPTAALAASTDWYKSPDVARRLNREHERLVEKYHVEAGLDADGRMVFRLMPREGYGRLTFHLACGPGFPDDGPTAFLMVGGKPHPLFSPSLTIWSAEHWLVEMADDMVEWLIWSLDDYLAAAEEALGQGAYQVAVDWLTIVLSINPRAPRAARLLAQAQAPLG